MTRILIPDHARLDHAFFKNMPLSVFIYTYKSRNLHHYLRPTCLDISATIADKWNDINWLQLFENLFDFHRRKYFTNVWMLCRNEWTILTSEPCWCCSVTPIEIVLIWLCATMLKYIYIDLHNRNMFELFIWNHKIMNVKFCLHSTLMWRCSRCMHNKK